MDVLTRIGLFELAAGAVSGWVVVAATQKADWFRSRGVPVPHRFLQAHIDLLMMALILIAVGLAVPTAPGWIKSLIVFGAIVNPLLFVPLAWGPKVAGNLVYRAIAIVSFSSLSVGLTALALEAV